MDTRQFILIGLASIAAGGLTYSFIAPRMDGEIEGEKRKKALTTSRIGFNENVNKAANRFKQVADSLQEIERKKEAQDKLTLNDRIIQAGLTWDRNKFIMVSGICAIGFALAGLAIFGSIFAGIGGFVVGAFGVPNWILSFLRKRRVAAFIQELPNAIDIIVRGVKSGLPLGDCIRIIATESVEPVKGEFRQMVEAQTIGMSLPEAVAGISKRMPTPEANFFAIVVEIQSKAGGNLSEVLGNLSKVLRARRQMRGKVSAMSMEAKASAGIIASLPFVVAILVYLSSPDYIMILFTTEAGKITMVMSAIWMFFGIMSMKKMINFDI